MLDTNFTGDFDRFGRLNVVGRTWNVGIDYCYALIEVCERHNAGTPSAFRACLKRALFGSLL